MPISRLHRPLFGAQLAACQSPSLRGPAENRPATPVPLHTALPFCQPASPFLGGPLACEASRTLQILGAASVPGHAMALVKRKTRGPCFLGTAETGNPQRRR